MCKGLFKFWSWRSRLSSITSNERIYADKAWKKEKNVANYFNEETPLSGGNGKLKGLM